MIDIPKLKAALTEATGTDFSGAQPNEDLVEKYGVDSIAMVELFFILEQDLPGEIETSQLKVFCRRQRPDQPLQIRMQDILDYLAAVFP